jgi:hypothetical protein
MPSAVHAETTQAEAQSDIAAAQKELIVCYQAVTNASNAGANVTSLLLVLDQAGGNLSRADFAYATGDNASALHYANQSLNLLLQSKITAQADTLKSSAFQARFWSFMVDVVGSSIGAVAVVVGGFVVWAFLKRKYSPAGGIVR